jgi:diguanylate cyclase (GGDEF)-like protein
LFVPWLGIVRPPPELSQPLHAALQSSSAAALALFAFALLRGVRARSIGMTAYVVWSLVAADAVTAWGGDVMQDTWPVPSVISFALAAGFDVALFALGAIGLRRRVAGARALCAGAACATLALAASLADPTPASVVLGPTLSIVCYALAAVRALGPRAAAESPAPARDAAAGLPARPIFGAPPPREATTDGLTGIPNRAAMAAALDRAWAHARASHKPVALLRIDIDHFRRYNDAQGPDAGDHALCRLAAALAAALPPNAAEAMVARDGGDEFCILLPGASLDAAHGFGERIRAAVDALAIARDDVPARRLTVSIGAASLDPACVDDAFLAFARANAALYIAKAMGRDRVVVDEPVPPSELAR